MRANFVFYVCIFCILKLCYSQHSLENEFNKFLNSPEMATSHIGFVAKYPTSNKVIYQYQSNKWFSTASTLKLITTATAYEILGANYVFETKIYYTGIIQNQVLNGDIIIKGTGDPTLGSSRFQETPESIINSITKSIKDAGISKIAGSIVYEVGHYDLDPLGPKTFWLDMGNYFGGSVWPINLNENINTITFSRSKKIGDSTKILQISPQSTLNYDNQVTVLGSKDEAFIYLAPYSGNGFIKGTLPLGSEPYTIKGAIPNMFQYFTDLLFKKLNSEAVEIKSVNYKLSKTVTSNKIQIWEHKSPTLDAIIQQTNWYSINLYAESILRAVALKKSGFASSNNGIRVVKDFLESLNLNTNAINMTDGSGISIANMLSPNLMCDFLIKVRSKPWFTNYEKSLSKSGVNGTLKNFGSNTALVSNFIGKSGNIDGVCCYAGYIKSKTGKKIAVSIFVNNFKAENGIVKNYIEKVLIQLLNL